MLKKKSTLFSLPMDESNQFKPLSLVLRKKNMPVFKIRREVIAQSILNVLIVLLLFQENEFLFFLSFHLHLLQWLLFIILPMHCFVLLIVFGPSL